MDGDLGVGCHRAAEGVGDERNLRLRVVPHRAAVFLDFQCGTAARNVYFREAPGGQTADRSAFVDIHRAAADGNIARPRAVVNLKIGKFGDFYVACAAAFIDVYDGVPVVPAGIHAVRHAAIVDVKSGAGVQCGIHRRRSRVDGDIGIGHRRAAEGVGDERDRRLGIVTHRAAVFLDFRSGPAAGYVENCAAVDGYIADSGVFVDVHAPVELESGRGLSRRYDDLGHEFILSVDCGMLWYTIPHSVPLFLPVGIGHLPDS